MKPTADHNHPEFSVKESRVNLSSAILEIFKLKKWTHKLWDNGPLYKAVYGYTKLNLTSKFLMIPGQPPRSRYYWGTLTAHISEESVWIKRNFTPHQSCYEEGG